MSIFKSLILEIVNENPQYLDEVGFNPAKHLRIEYLPEEKVTGRTIFNASINNSQWLYIIFNKNYEEVHNIYTSRGKEAAKLSLRKTFRHELRHFAQISWLYTFFKNREKTEEFINQISKKYSYWENPLEKDARKAEYSEKPVSIRMFIQDLLSAHSDLL